MQTGKEESKKKPEYFEVVDKDLSSSLSGGVMPDNLSIRVIALWTFVISIVVIILIAISFNLYKYYKFNQEFEKAVQSEYREINNLRADANHNLTTFEVIDDEQGIYRIPVDSAMSLIIRDYQQE